MNWAKGIAFKVNEIKDRLTKNTNVMKFDVIIGNPPYQEEVEGTSNPPVYNYFMDESYRNAQIVELITPARFLFNTGKTPAEWNKKMLADSHLKVLYYDTETVKAYNRVKTAIQKHARTITLSVGQLTTGVTIPEWNGILMLSNMQSAQLYMQAAFRAQKPSGRLQMEKSWKMPQKPSGRRWNRLSKG